MSKKHINLYPNRDAYNAAAGTRPTDASVASLIGVRGQYDGINVITDTSNPEPGDSVWYDKLQRRRVLVKHGTLVRSLMDTDRYFPCEHVVVGHIYGRVVCVATEQLASQKYAEGDEWSVVIDTSTAGTATLEFKYYNANSSNTKQLELTWEAGADISTLVSAINNATDIKSYCVASKVDSTTIRVMVNGYNSGQGITLVSGDATVSRTHKGYQYTNYGSNQIQTIVRHGSLAAESSAYVQPEIYLEYISSSGADATNQTISDPTIKKSRFNATDNPDLYAQFNGDYDAYVAEKFDQYRAEFPINRVALGNPKYRFGDPETANLAAVSYTNLEGGTTYDFPQPRTATLQGVTLDGHTTGFEPGTGHLGGIAEAFLLYTQIKKAKDDPINVAILAEGGTAVGYKTTTRLVFQSIASGAWVFGGHGGTLGSGTRYLAYVARVFRAFIKSDF